MALDVYEQHDQALDDLQAQKTEKLQKNVLCTS